MTPLADMRDGLLDVCVLRQVAPQFTVYWTAALMSAHIQHSKVGYFRTEAARVGRPRRDGEVLVQTDGEPAGHLPVD